MINIVFLWR